MNGITFGTILRTFAPIWVLVAVALAALPARGASIYTQGFETLNTGVLGGQGGFTDVTVTGQATVEAGGLTYSSNAVSIPGGSRDVTFVSSNINDWVFSSTFPTQTGTVYFSLSLTWTHFNEAGDGNDNFFYFALSDAIYTSVPAALAYSGGLTVNNNGNGNVPSFGGRIRKDSAGNTITTIANFNLGISTVSPQFAVASLSKSGANGADYDTLKVWVNPSNLTEGTADVTITRDLGKTNLTTFFFFCGSNNEGNEVVKVDNIQIGTTWADVTTVPPTLSPPNIGTSSASGIAGTAATMNGFLISTGALPTTAFVYWGTVDCGTNAPPPYWANTNSFGLCAAGSLSTNITGLAYGTKYYYTFAATNTQGAGWGNTFSFTTLGPPSISNLYGSGVTTTSCLMKASLTSTGAALTTVYLYWGTNDCGTNALAWQHPVSLGNPAPGAVSTNVTGLDFGTAYYYVFYATNQYGDSWGSPSTYVKTLSPMATYTSALGTVSIPDGTGGILTSQVTVADGYRIGRGGVVVAFTNLSHGYVSDLKFTLIGPDGTSVAFFRLGPGNYPGIFNSANSYAFGDQYTPIPAQGVGVTWGSGLYATTNYSVVASLNTAFVGKSSLGTWTLLVMDQYGGDAGTFGGWMLELNRPRLLSGAVFTMR